ncbi:MAG: deoxyribonuclease IV [Ruminococcus sp.]|nr:deoxyribonuclease IV [Ruminococcus sp.]
MIIGSHVSFGKEQLLGSVKEALSYGANTFMFYTGAPQNTIRKNIDKSLLEEARTLMQENDIDINNVICHAPYIINLANNDPTKYDFSINFLKKELERCKELGIKYLVLHPGSSVGIPVNEALDNIVFALNKVINSDTETMILLETMAGKGTELGRDLGEIKYIIDGVDLKEKIGVCLDTCHLNDAGYDMANFSEFLEEFDKIVGLNYIRCIHINDSKNPFNSHKDRHANIGFGTIGFNNLLNIINCEALKDIPKILETPYIGNSDDDKERLYPPYKMEIAMIKEKEFNTNLMEDIRNYYK